ncbi:MAG: PKD domain-containing protein [Methanoregulaceae archaeon]|nr:PKD domain-containing protein [Methanoregulaceae archaeon]
MKFIGLIILVALCISGAEAAVSYGCSGLGYGSGSLAAYSCGYSETGLFPGNCSGLYYRGCPFDTCNTTRYMKPMTLSSLPSFIAYPTTGSAPLPVQFYAMVPGATGSFLWDFGDGSGSSAMDPVHVYTAPGIYTVSLTYSRINRQATSDWTFSSSVTKKDYIVVTGSNTAAGTTGVAGVSRQSATVVVPSGGSAVAPTLSRYEGAQGLSGWGSTGIAQGSSGNSACQVSIPAYPKFTPGSFPV